MASSKKIKSLILNRKFIFRSESMSLEGWLIISTIDFEYIETRF